MLSDLHNLALRLAPELASAGLTLLQHQPAWPYPNGADAYATRGRALHIRDHLQATGRWSGAWGCYIVFVEQPPTIPTLIHELAHILPAKPAEPDDSGEATNEQRCEYIAALVRTVNDNAARVEPWAGHGARWIRRALHLHQRVVTAGFDVRLADCNIAGQGYGLEHPDVEYLRELGAEPQYLSQKTFAEIDAEPMPPRFKRLFANDVARFHYDLTMESL